MTSGSRRFGHFDQVQVCTPQNWRFLLEFLPGLVPKVRDGLRAGIDTSNYEFRPEGREPATMLFLGSSRHDPNRVALDWFVRADFEAAAGGAADDRGVGPTTGAYVCGR